LPVATGDNLGLSHLRWVVGSVDESVYLLKSDSGSNFRIDSTKCQYSYNLGASSLGPGIYQVFISIGGSVAGSATFALK
jgi:hypothetical protein